MWKQSFLSAPALVLAVGCAAYAQDAVKVSAQPDHQRWGFVWREVSGSGVHYLTTAIVHSSRPTANGMVQRSTETVELEGDLTGRVLYHPVSVFDFAAGTLVNTGHQVYSGTVLGSRPVMLHDDEFRFDVDLNTGATTGEVHLVDRIAGPRTRCHLQVTGTGMTPEGNSMIAYSGWCLMRRAGRAGDAAGM